MQCMYCYFGQCVGHLPFAPLSTLYLVADICEQHEGALLPSGFLLGMADGKHLQESGGQNASEVSFPRSSFKGLSPYQEAFPTPSSKNIFLSLLLQA